MVRHLLQIAVLVAMYDRLLLLLLLLLLITEFSMPVAKMSHSCDQQQTGNVS